MPQSPESLLQLIQRFLRRQNQVRQIHALIITNGHFLCRSEWKSTLLYNALIRAHLGFGQNQHKYSLFLFTEMLAHEAPPNGHTFASLVKAVARSSFSLGPPVHAQAVRRGVLGDRFVRTSFVSLYAECGRLWEARKMFDEMPERCVVACNAMINAFCKNGDVGSAVCLFERMPERDVVSWTSIVNGLRANSWFCKAVRFFERMVSWSVRPNEATYVSLLGCCVALDGWGGLELGKQVHGYMIRNEARLTIFMGTALIDLYGKSGLLRAASNVFDHMVVREVCTWNAMISAFAYNGQERKALALFDKMKVEGLKPNEITFVAILTACARGKLVELGLELFRSMQVEFGVAPIMEHYGCVIDLLGRAGLVRDAMEVLKSMPFKPDASVLGALLGACKIFGATELGDEVGRKLIDLQRKHSGRYVVLSNINASMQLWDRAAEFRKMMVNAGVEKIPAYSLIA